MIGLSIRSRGAPGAAFFMHKAESFSFDRSACGAATQSTVFFRRNLNECAAMEFGSEIRRRRLVLGMTLEQLAESSGLTPNYIGTIENGKRDPSLSTVLALAKGLRVQPAELFGGVQDLSPPATEAGLLFDSAAPDVQDAVLQILRSVSRRRRIAKTKGMSELTPLRDVG